MTTVTPSMGMDVAPLVLSKLDLHVLEEQALQLTPAPKFEEMDSGLALKAVMTAIQQMETAAATLVL